MLRGPTGVGKTEVLHALASQGAQVLDLEALACHRGSAFGGIDQPRQPTHTAFESGIADAWQTSSSTRPLFCEEEGDYLGSVGIPRALLDAAFDAPWIELRAPVHARVARLVRVFGGASPDALRRAAGSIRRLPRPERTEVDFAITDGDLARAARTLLGYYDRAYAHRRARVTQPALFVLDDASPDMLAAAIVSASR